MMLGLVGRWIIIDAYQCGDFLGKDFAYEGSVFSGKDLTKVDRNVAYIAKQVAKSIVANELAHHCII